MYINIHEFNGLYTNWLYNLKQYDQYKILNELVHITLLNTINICAE